MTNRPLRVFLCHSSNDKPAVRELYQKLRAESWIQPWLDEEELYPGQDWSMEIEKAVEAADAIIVCLSKGSITKEGYVQRELRIVLDFADYKPEGTLYVIPVRLEECDPPRRLRAWQYADYFEGQRERAFNRLLVSLKRRSESLGLGTEEPILEESKLVKKEISGMAWLDDYASKHARNLEDLTDKPKIEMSKSVGVTSSQSIKSVGNSIDKIEHLTQTLLGLDSSTVEYPSKITLSNGIEFVNVPAGKFLMGSNNGDDAEKPQHSVNISYNYLMARYPITNELYNEYVKSKKVEHPVSDWRTKKDHPVVNIKWTEIMTYCQWANNLLKDELPSGLVLRLPTEAEWEKAARGVDGREYPWGNVFDGAKYNVISEYSWPGIYESFTSSVNKYSPRGDSPYGCADMVGNVWEWTHSLNKKYPYSVDDGREDEKSFGRHIQRGSSFTVDKKYAHCAFRIDGGILNLGSRDRGFRVCLAPPLPK
jgi:formylglycine-generating enzyme required for sulfatase activity